MERFNLHTHYGLKTKLLEHLTFEINHKNWDILGGGGGGGALISEITGSVIDCLLVPHKKNAYFYHLLPIF